jgi:hypothetical protein
VWFWIGSHADYDRLVGSALANHAPRVTRSSRRTGKQKSRRSPRG